MRYVGRRGRWVSVQSLQTIRNRLHVFQLKSRKAAQKPLLTAGVTIEFIDDQFCLWAVAHYWHWEVLANFRWTPPLFSGPYLSLWSCYRVTLSSIWKGIDTPIKWHNRFCYTPNSRVIHVAPQRHYSELLLLSLYRLSVCVCMFECVCICEQYNAIYIIQYIFIELNRIQLQHRFFTKWKNIHYDRIIKYSLTMLNTMIPPFTYSGSQFCAHVHVRSYMCVMVYVSYSVPSL